MRILFSVGGEGWRILGLQRTKRDKSTLLSALLFRGKALDEALQNYSDNFDRVIKNLDDIQVQAALVLLRSCFGAAKLTYLMWTSPCWNHPMLIKMDHQMRTGLEKIINSELNDTKLLQALLPVRDGGFWIRRLLSTQRGIISLVGFSCIDCRARGHHLGHGGVGRCTPGWNDGGSQWFTPRCDGAYP